MFRRKIICDSLGAVEEPGAEIASVRVGPYEFIDIEAVASSDIQEPADKDVALR